MFEISGSGVDAEPSFLWRPKNGESIHCGLSFEGERSFEFWVYRNCTEVGVEVLIKASPNKKTEHCVPPGEIGYFNAALTTVQEIGGC